MIWVVLLQVRKARTTNIFVQVFCWFYPIVGMLFVLVSWFSWPHCVLPEIFEDRSIRHVVFVGLEV